MHPMDQFANIGDNVSFTCEATGGFGQFTYAWLLNGVVLMADPGHLSDVNTTTLMITNVTATDEGNYSCFVSDGNTNLTSNEATLFSKSVVRNFKVYSSIFANST